MIAELKHSKNYTMQEDAGDIDTAATPSSAILPKDERISNIGAAATTTAASFTATAGTASHSRQMDLPTKYESESSCVGYESTMMMTTTTSMTTTPTTTTTTPTNYKRKLMFAFSQAGSVGSGSGGGGRGGGGGGIDDDGSIVGIKSEKDNMEMMASSATDKMQPECKKLKLQVEKEQMFEQFQPWALKTYGDQAKTKTITLRKKARILKALEGKEHSKPDSSKFRFWVKSKAFTTVRPESFENIPDYPASSNTEYPNNIDLFVASTTKDFGQRIYRKVAVVEEFFNIIYNIHVEMGGRSGRHAGQKRTYRIITETYAFLPREAVTRFLSACPECKKNLRPLSPGQSPADEEMPNESSTEIDVLNVSSQAESSIEIPKSSIPHFKVEATPSITLQYRKKPSPTISPIAVPKEEIKTPTEPLTFTSASSSTAFTFPSTFPKIRVNPTLQPPFIDPNPIRNGTPATSAISTTTTSTIGPQMNFGMLNRESLIRYYEFMRILYGQSTPPMPPQQQPPEKISAKKEPSEAPRPTATQQNLTLEDEPSTSAASLALHSESFRGSSTPTSTSSTIPSSQQVRAINLSKPLFSSSSDTSTPSHDVPPQTFPPEILVDPMPTLVPPQLIHVPQPPTQVKQEPHSDQTQQLDLRKLKPITSTYLTLTRSMGLSDSDALMLDDLVSKDFKYTL